MINLDVVIAHGCSRRVAVPCMRPTRDGGGDGGAGRASRSDHVVLLSPLSAKGKAPIAGSDAHCQALTKAAGSDESDWHDLL